MHLIKLSCISAIFSYKASLPYFVVDLELKNSSMPETKGLLIASYLLSSASSATISFYSSARELSLLNFAISLASLSSILVVWPNSSSCIKFACVSFLLSSSKLISDFSFSPFNLSLTAKILFLQSAWTFLCSSNFC